MGTAVNRASGDCNKSLLDVLNQLLECCQNIDANTDEIEAKLDTQILLLTSIDAELAVQGITLDDILLDTTEIIAQLVTLNGVDFATETTLNDFLTAFNNTDFATETTLSLLKGVVDAIKLDTANLDVALSTRATEVTLNALLTAFNAEDFATETTLNAIKVQTDKLNFTGLKLRTTGEDGGGGGGGSSINDKLLQVDSVAPNTTYLGYADPGSLTSASVWAIKKIVETGNDVSITWADGDNSFDNVWDDRLILSYS